MTSHPGIVLGPLTVLTWNLFHGRDFPPDRALFTPRSRLLRVTERNATHEQVNRDLLPEFGTVLDRLPWGVCLLQEVPPRWRAALPARAHASAVNGLTSRNQLAALRALAARINPDLIASNDGGSNMIMVRPPGRIERVARVMLATRPERRTLLLARVTGLPVGPLCIACMHLSVDSTGNGPAELVHAVELAVAFAGDDPVVLGGDLNLRPQRDPEPFRSIASRYGFSKPAEPRRIDHLLARGLTVSSPPRSLPASAREVPAHAGRVLRLSDHNPVAATFEVR